MCWVGRWYLLCLVLLQGHAYGVGGILANLAQGMPDPPLHPHPGSCLGKIDLVHFILVVTLMRMTCWDLPETFLTYKAQFVMHCL